MSDLERVTLKQIRYFLAVAEHGSLRRTADRLEITQPTLTAQIAALDLVISIDNSTVHIAGAVGTPCWVLLPASQDWRWAAVGESTPLYESLRLFRNSQLHHWGGVVAEVSEALEAWTPV